MTSSLSTDILKKIGGNMGWIDIDIPKEKAYNETRLDRHEKYIESLFEKLDVLSEYLGVEIEYKEAGYKVKKKRK